MTEETIQGAGGVDLFLRGWHPDAKPRGIVVINHGFLAHSRLYQWPAAHLTRLGFGE